MNKVRAKIRSISRIVAISKANTRLLCSAHVQKPLFSSFEGLHDSAIAVAKSRQDYPFFSPSLMDAESHRQIIV